jgi:hypothetical protein
VQEREDAQRRALEIYDRLTREMRADLERTMQRDPLSYLRELAARRREDGIDPTRR